MTVKQATIDLNADLGEGMGDDDAMLAIVTSANIACGAHAGDDETMRQTCAAAVARGVRIGAHVSYVDRANFGRRDVDIEPAVLTAQLLAQINALVATAHAAGGEVGYVKAHGALYNRCAYDRVHSEAVVEAVCEHDGGLALLAAPGSVIVSIARAQGLRVVTEAFVDRAYRADGTLVARSEHGAVHHDPAVGVAQALGIAHHATVLAADGTRIALRADSLCVHGDTPAAVSMAHAVREALSGTGIALRPFL